MAGFVASSGTLIGATLETLGYVYQNIVLDVFHDPFRSSIGGFIYMLGAVIALVTYVVSGRYKMGAWFFIGPSLFFLAIGPRADIAPAEWRFGSEVRDNAEVKRQVGDALDAEGESLETIRVSSLFNKYNKLVSGTVQQFISVINQDRYKSDLKFILRAELLASMHGKTLPEPRLRELLHHAFLRDCRDVIEAGKEANNFRKSEEEKTALRAKFDSLRADTRVSLAKSALKHVALLKASYPTLLDPMVTRGIVANGSQEAIADWLRGVSSENVEYRDDRYFEELRTLRKNNSFTCDEIWLFVVLGIHRYAASMADSAIDYGEKQGLDKDELVSDLAAGFGFNVTDDLTEFNSRTEALYRVISQYILRNEISQGNVSSFINDFAQKTSHMSRLYAPVESDVSALERQTAETREWSEKTGVMITATKLPYYQGLGLYLLGISYPFFALLLLMPGKHAGFLLWFFYWLWFKTWDIGFALVMVIDNLLFALMSEGPRAVSANEQGKLTGPEVDFGMTFYSLKDLDPTFQLSVYYSIIGIAINSVPVITSYLVLGSLKGGHGMIASGVENFSKPLMQASQNAQQQGIVMGIRNQALNMEMSRAAHYMSNQMAGNVMYAGTGGVSPGRPSVLQNPADPTWTEPLRGGLERTDTGNLSDSAALQRALRFGEGLTGGLADGIPGGNLTPVPVPVAAKLGKKGIFSKQEQAALARNSAKNKFIVNAMLGLKKGAAVAEPILGAGADYVEALRDKNLQLGHSWAQYDAVYSKEYQQFGTKARAYGMMEIPWGAKPAYEEELNLEIEQMNAMVKAIAKGSDSLKQLFTPMPKGKQLARKSVPYNYPFMLDQRGLTKEAKEKLLDAYWNNNEKTNLKAYNASMNYFKWAGGLLTAGNVLGGLFKMYTSESDEERLEARREREALAIPTEAELKEIKLDSARRARKKLDDAAND